MENCEYTRFSPEASGFCTSGRAAPQITLMEQMTLDTRLAQTDLGVNKGLPEMYGVAPWDFHGQDYHRHEFLRSLVMLSHMEGPGGHPRAGLTPASTHI